MYLVSNPVIMSLTLFCGIALLANFWICITSAVPYDNQDEPLRLGAITRADNDEAGCHLVAQ